MTSISGFLKAVFNFVVGDWILLIGVTLLFGLILALFLWGSILDNWLGPVVFVGALILILFLSLMRETRPKR